jgi:hypothetical protein
MLIQHWFLVGTWQNPYRSLVKAAKLVRHHALELLSALVQLQVEKGRVQAAAASCV